MNFKAFQKIEGETYEALEERRLSDALALAQSIAKDTKNGLLLSELETISNDYDALLRFALTGQKDEERLQQVNSLFCRFIDTFHVCRRHWLLEHKENIYGRIISQITDITTADALDQLHRTTLSNEGTPAFYEALDAAFAIISHQLISPSEVPQFVRALQTVNPFCKQVIASALFVALLNCYERSKVQLLIHLGAMADETDDEELRTRVLMGLALTYICYPSHFTYDTTLAQELSTYLSSEKIRPELPSLLYALTLSSLSDRVGKQLDDFFSIVKEAIEKQKPWSKDGTSSQEGQSVMKVMKLDEQQGERWMRMLSKQARETENLRQDGFDVNITSMSHLKNFRFFDHEGHWFYPFSEKVPLVQKMLFDKNGKRNNMRLSILRHNSFCASDCYSFLCMLDYTSSFHALEDFMDPETREAMSSMLEDLEDAPHLPIMIDYCQCCFRFIKHYADEFVPLTPFALSDRLLLPLQPLFAPLLTDYDDISDTVEALIRMGASTQAVILLDAIQSRSGANASLLRQKGFALMQQELFARAASAFQQAQLMDDDSTLGRLTAQCLEALGRWEEALNLLRISENSSAFDASLAEEIASCLIHLKRWEEASDKLFQVEFEEKATDNTRRAIAWCALHQGRFDRAITYYKHLADQRKKMWVDMLNLGHAYWLNGQIAEAKSTYCSYVRLFNRAKKKHHFKHWTEPIHEDYHNLLQEYITNEDLGLMLDAIDRLPDD